MPHATRSRLAHALALLHTRIATLKSRQRHDVVLHLSFAGIWVFCAALVLATVIGFNRTGLFERPLLEPLADERLNSSLRDGLVQQPLLDATWAPGQQEVVIAQKGGVLHRYDPALRYWSYPERPSAALRDPELVAISAGWGDPLSSLAASCPDPESLWALSAGQALLRRHKGKWQVIFDDTCFEGNDGQLVDQKDLRSAAVSDDGKLLAFGTVAKGIGVYDARTGRWLPLDAPVRATLGSASIDHLVWWRDRFWFGGPSGLGWLRPLSDSLLVEWVNTDGATVDLDATSAYLWATFSLPGPRLQVLRFDHPNGQGDVIFDEQNHYDQLGLGNLQAASYQHPYLTLAGKAGVFAYDTRLHGWQSLTLAPATAALKHKDRGLFLGGKNWLGYSSKGALAQVSLDKQMASGRVHQITPGQKPNEALALTDQGDTLALDDRGEASLLHHCSGFSFAPESFQTAIGFDDTVLLTGRDGLVLHNIRDRSYVTLNPEPWLTYGGLEMVRSSNALYSFVFEDGLQAVWMLPWENLQRGDFKSVTRWNGLPRKRPDSELRPWGEGIAYLSTSQAVLCRSDFGKPISLSAPPAENKGPILDVAIEDNFCFFARARGLSTYDLNERIWLPDERTLNGSDLNELALFNGTLARTQAGDLVSFSDKKTLIGDYRFTAAASAWQDVLATDHGLFIASGSKLEHYDVDARSVTRTLTLGGLEPIDLKAVVGSEPLTLQGKSAYMGDKLLGPANVLNLSRDDTYIWTLREDRNRRYLQANTIHKLDEGLCLFRNPSPGPNVSRLNDARKVSEPLLAITTNDGLRFYHSAFRSWYQPKNLGPGVGSGYVYRFPDFICLVDQIGDAYRISRISPDLICNSCSTEPLAVKLLDSWMVRAYAVDESSHLLAWIEPDGAVVHLEGRERVVDLASPNTGPAQADVRHLYGQGKDLWLTTDREVWRYDLEQQQWLRLNLDGLPNEPSEISLEFGVEDWVICRSPSGIDAGVLTARGVTLRPVFRTPQTRWLGGALHQVGQFNKSVNVSDHQWFFSSSKGVSVFDSNRREWHNFSFDHPDSTIHLAGDRFLVKGHDDRVWYLANGSGLYPEGWLRQVVDDPDQTFVSEDGQLVWLDQGALCRQSADGLQREDSLRINPKDLLAGWQDEELILFQTPRGLEAMDPITSKPLTVDLMLSSDPLKVYKDGDQYWIDQKGILVVLRKSTSGTTMEIDDSQDQLPKTAVALTDVRIRLAKLLVPVTGQGYVFDPLTSLAAKSGALLGQRPSGRQPLGIKVVELQSLSPLDQGWIRWRKGSKPFELKAPRGWSAFTQEQLTIGAHFIFEDVWAVSSKEGKTWHAVNGQGLWTFPNPELKLTERQITFAPHAPDVARQLRADTLVACTQDTLYTRNAMYTMAATGLKSLAKPPETSTSGLVFRNLGKSAISEFRKKPLNLQKLPWEQRFDLAFHKGVVQLHTEVGIHDLTSFEKAIGCPDGTGRGHLFTQDKMYFSDGNRWWFFDGSTWKPSQDPLKDRIMIDDGKTQWAYVKGQLQINTKNGSGGSNLVKWPVQGAFFDHDVLLDGLSYDGKLLIDTPVSFQIGTFQAVLDQTAPSLPPLSKGTLRNYESTQGSHLLRETQSGLFLFDGKGFTPSKSDPSAQAVLYQAGPLKVQRQAAGVRLAMKVKDLTGHDRWLPIALEGGRFPFDAVTGIQVSDNRLWVATSGGLQSYSGHDFSLLSMGDLLNRGSNYSIGFDFLGLSRRDGALYARSDSGQWLAMNQGVWSPRQPPDEVWLDVESDLWLWTHKTQQPTRGYYKSGNQVAGDTIDMSLGLLPHDRIQDLANQGGCFSLWGSGWVSAHPGAYLELAGARSQLLKPAPQKLVSVPHDVNINGVPLKRGVYAAASGRVAWCYQGNSWQALSGPLVGALMDYAEHPPLLQVGDIRLLKTAGRQRFQFEYRDSARNWKELPWLKDRLAIDQWDKILQVDDQLWASTPLGLCRFDASGNLDPDHLRILEVRGNLTSDKRVTDMSLDQEGKALLRYDDGLVLQGDLTSKAGEPVFVAVEKDPFFEEEMVTYAQSGVFRFKRTETLPGNSGYLQASYRLPSTNGIDQADTGHGIERDLDMVGGRFPFDALQGIAFERPDRAQLATSAGWLQAPPDQLSLQAMMIPQLKGIESVSVTQAYLSFYDNQEVLALELSGEKWIWRADFEQPQHLQDILPYLGSDGTWRYFRNANSIEAKAIESQPGPGYRQLAAGRFNDDRVIGTPTVGRDDAGLFYLIPTEAGIWRFNDTLKRESLYVPPFPGCDGTVPRAVLSHRNQILYACQSGLFDLDHTRPQIYQAPQGVWDRVIRLETGPYETLQVRFLDANQQNHRMFLVPNGSVWEAWPLDLRPVLVGNFTNFQAFNSGEAQRDVLSLGWYRDSFTMGTFGAEPKLRQDLPSLNTLNLLPYQDRMLVIGDRELYELNLDKGMIQLMQATP